MLKDKKGDSSWRGFAWGSEIINGESKEANLSSEDLESVSGGNFTKETPAQNDEVLPEASDSP